MRTSTSGPASCVCRRRLTFQVRLVTALLTLVLSAFCSQQADKETPSEESQPEPAGTRMRGEVILGHEVREFKPCGEDVALWVIPSPELVDAYEALSYEAYAPVYVELRGEFGPPPETGFGADYDGQLTVLSLMRAAPAAESRGCAEELNGIAFRASGNEPFWNARVSREEIVFSALGAADLIFPSVAPRPEQGGWIYQTETDSNFIVLTVEEGSCSDTMVGARYSWRARVTVNSDTYEGCAWEGDDTPGAFSWGVR